MKINKNWQKICTSQDYFDNEFKYVLEEKLKQPPTFHRKQWEFVVIYLNLLKYGKLNKEAVGASFGAGRERLIFDISKEVKSLLATDLYVYNTAWATAKVEENMSCFNFVLEKAPKGFDASNLTVKEMDMRKLGIEDDSLDFAYSSCAFEHIGHFDDFVNHLKEVKRVLKDDGIYVMTTEHLFMHDTMPMKGNYKFKFSDLMDIFSAADFYPDQDFDARLPRSAMNKPKPDYLPLLGFDQDLQNQTSSVIINRHGIPQTSSCFVFKKSNTHSINYLSNEIEQTGFLKNSINQSVKKLYSNVKSIDPTKSLRKEGRTALADHIEYLSDDFEKYLPIFPTNLFQFVFTDFIYFSDFNFKFSIYLNVSEKIKVKAKLIERPQVNNKKRKAVMKTVQKVQDKTKISFEYKAKSDCVYAVSVSAKELGEIKLDYLDVRAQLVSD